MAISCGSTWHMKALGLVLSHTEAMLPPLLFSIWSTGCGAGCWKAGTLTGRPAIIWAVHFEWKSWFVGLRLLPWLLLGGTVRFLGELYQSLCLTRTAFWGRKYHFMGLLWCWHACSEVSLLEVSFLLEPFPGICLAGCIASRPQDPRSYLGELAKLEKTVLGVSRAFWFWNLKMSQNDMKIPSRMKKWSIFHTLKGICVFEISDLCSFHLFSFSSVSWSSITLSCDFTSQIMLHRMVVSFNTRYMYISINI